MIHFSAFAICQYNFLTNIPLKSVQFRLGIGYKLLISKIVKIFPNKVQN